MTTIRYLPDLHFLFESMKDIKIEVWAPIYDQVREVLLESCTRHYAKDVYEMVSEDENGFDVRWTVRIIHVFGS